MAKNISVQYLEVDMRNIVKERRKSGAVCPRCNHPDYIMKNPIEGETIKPQFICNSCGNSWCYGYDGGKYAKLSNFNVKNKS